MPADQPESFSQKVWLLVIDKLFLGLIVALGGYLLSIQLQHREKAIDYQRGIFDKRLQAYTELVAAAKEARDEFVLLHLGGADTIDVSEFVWRGRIEHTQAKINQKSGGGGSDSTWTTYDDAIKKLRNLEDIRRANALYISEAVDKALDQYLVVLWRDLDQELTLPRAKAADNRQFQAAARRRTIEAFEIFAKDVRRALRVDSLIIG